MNSYIKHVRQQLQANLNISNFLAWIERMSIKIYEYILIFLCKWADPIARMINSCLSFYVSLNSKALFFVKQKKMNVERSRLVGRSNNFNYRKYEEKQYHKYFYLIRKVKNWGLEPKFWRFFSVISKLHTTYCLAHLLTHIWWVQGKKLDDLGWPHRTINRKFKKKVCI